ncbi:RNA-directed DNA polymerase, eukaryota, reverse transcriptase zinc-binding domain protein [Tanacetum coccineum]
MNENRDDDIEGKNGCLDNGNNCINDSAKSGDCVEVVNEGDDSSNNECGKEFNDKDEEVVKKANVGNQNSGSKESNSSAGKSLADIVKSNRLDNKLIQVPTKFSETGDNVVVFDDEIIELGSQKWNLTDEEGIKEVINNGPWMVNNKPLVVQKWSIDMCMDKAEPKRIHVWVKIRNVLMEAWSVKGISALTSSIRKPVIMDEITTRMYVTGVGRIGFARVLVEIDAEKGIKDKIEIMYKSKSISRKSPTVTYQELVLMLLQAGFPSSCEYISILRCSGANDTMILRRLFVDNSFWEGLCIASWVHGLTQSLSAINSQYTFISNHTYGTAILTLDDPG